MSLENNDALAMVRPSIKSSPPTTTTTTTTRGVLLARRRPQKTPVAAASVMTFTKADLEETERDLLSQCERTRDGEEDEAIRAVVAGGEKEAIRLAVVGERENFDDDDDDAQQRLARDGRMVLKMARRKEQMDEFTYEREKKEKEEEEEERTTTTTTREKLSEMNTESAKRTFELESKGWETEKTLVAEEEDDDGAQRIEEKEGRGGGGIEEEEEEEEEDRTQRYGDAPTQTQTNNQYSNSAGQSRNDLFRASGIAGGGETIDPQGTQRAEPSFVEEEDEGREERATGLPVTTIAATQDNPEEEEEESEDDEDIEIIGTQVVASEDEEEEQQGKESEQDKEENKQQRGHNTAQMITEDTAEEPALEVEIEKEEEEEEGAGEVLATPADKPEVKNGQPPPLPPRRENVGSVILATELSTGTQNVSATVLSGSTRMVTVKAVASAAENALRKQIETRKKQAFGIESVAPQSLNPNSGEAEMQQTERNEEPDDREMAAQHDGKGEQENDDDNHDDDDDDEQQQQQHNQSPDLAEYFSQRVNATDDDEDEDEDEEEVVYRSQLTQQDDEGGVLHRPKNVKFTMPVILGDGEISSSEEEEDDRENVRDEEEEADEEEDDDDEEEMHRRKRKREIPLHAVRMSKRERKPKKFFDDTQRQEDAGIEGEEEEEEKEKEEKEKEAQQPPTCMPRNTTRRRSARAATTTTTSQKTTTPVSNTRAAKKKKTALPTSKTPSATATVSSSSKGQTWSNYLPGCPKCRYSSCNACRPMHDRAINGDESAQQRVIKWNERREEKVTSASRSLGKKAKASNIRMRRTSSVHATARTIDVSLTPQKQISTATKSRKTADKRRKSTQSVQQQSRRRNSVEDSAEKTKSITGGGGGKTTTALFSGLSFMITSMPSSRVVNEMRASITENGGCLLDNIPKFNSSKRVPARKQIVVLPTMNNNSGKRKETAKCLYARAIGARLCSVQWIRKSLEKNKIIENDDQYATQPTKLRFEGTSYMLLGNTFFQDEFSNLMLHAGANSVMTCGKMTKNALNQALRRAQDEGNEIHAIVIQSSEKLSREIKSALSESRKVVVRHDWLTESLQRGKILEFLDYVVHV